MTRPILVVADHRDALPTVTTAEALTLARTLAEEVHVVWLDTGRPSAEALRRLADHGAATVHLPDLDGLDPHVTAVAAEAVGAVVAAVEPAAVLLVSNFLTREIAARLAVVLDSGAIVDATGVHRDETGRLLVTKAVLAGSWRSASEVRRGVPVITVKPAAIAAAPVDEARAGIATGPAGTPEAEDAGIEDVPRETEPSLVPHRVDYSATARAVRVVDRQVSDRDGVPLAEASVVVAGGRGVAGDFSSVRELATLLGGAVGATRDVIEEGWIGHSAQIGQTGTVIAPRLYVGVGISGAVHHTAGMRASQAVVAVNTDRSAPLMTMADLAVVGDASRVIPQAVAEIRRRRAQGA